MRNILFAIIALVLASCGGEMPTASGTANANLTPPEFAWEEEAPLSGVAEPTQPVSGNVSAPFDIGGVMRQVHFAFRKKDGLFEGGDTNYAVKVSKDGSFSVTPFHYPNGGKALVREERLDPREKIERLEQQARETPIEGTPATFRTASVSGITSVAPRLSTTNDKNALEIHHGEVVEELKNTENGVEQSWRFAKKPVTANDLTITVAVDGLDYIGTTNNGLHFAEKGSELGLRYGVGTWIDANGARTTIVPQWQDGTITLTVPRSVLENSAYPAILDPTIGPEFGMDEPIWGTTTANPQIHPAIAFDGTNYLVVWPDNRSFSNYDLYGTRISQDGTVLDTNGIAISTALNGQDYPVIAFDGTNYLVIWQDFRNGSYYDIYGARVTKEGTVLDPNGLAINKSSGNQTTPAIAFDGTNYLVVWNSLSVDNTISDVYGARVTKAGTVTNTIAISTAENAQAHPAIAFDGTNYLVVWEDYRNGNYDIFGARISKTATVLDPNGVAISTAVKSQLSPAIAFDGTNYFAVWVDRREGTTAFFLYGARISKTATVLDPNGIAICESTDNKRSPVIAFGGTNYLIAWNVFSGVLYSANGAWITKEGALIGSEWIISSPNGYNDIPPAVASSGNNRGMVVYQKFDDELQANRIKGRLFYNGAPGNSCENSDQCDSGNCVDGVCCVAPSCADDNVCTSDSCAVSGNGTCTHLAGNLGTECRSVAGDCDIAESCDGLSTECPADEYLPSIVECRAKDGDCDVADFCTGLSADCTEEVALPTVECRAQDGLCDVAENCDGMMTTCPDDSVALATVECRGRAGDCDVAENCDGTNKSCPNDLLAADTVVCRAAAGVCDAVETCTGSSINCPTDAKLTTECRPVVGICDIAESCNGISNDCPIDTVKNSATVCRTAINICDAAESCSGTNTFCPAEDYAAVNGDTCDDGNPYSLNDICMNGTCAGDIIDGVCGNAIAIDALPYTATGTTVGRPNALNAYGSACGDAGKPSPDIIYALAVEAGVEYLIEVAPEAVYDVTINLIGTCQNNQRCLGLSNGGGEGEPETISYSSASPRTIYIALEGTAKNEVGSYEISVTTVEAPDDTPLPDSDTAIEPDDATIMPDADTVIEPDDTVIELDADMVEPTDDSLVVLDEDSATTDDGQPPVDDSVTTDDGNPADTDIAVPDSTDTVATDADTLQPDEAVDEAVEDTDSIIPDEQTPVDTDTAKPNGNSGCGCTVLF